MDHVAYEKALEKMRAMRAQVDQFAVDMQDVDPDTELSEMWSALDGFIDALDTDIARIESWDI